MGNKFSKIIIILILILCGSKAFADAGCPVGPKIEHPTAPVEVLDPSSYDPRVHEEYTSTELAKKIFSLGRSIGASYYHLIDLSDKSINNAFTEIRQEYSDTFQTLNIIDIILDDINIQGKSSQDLNKIRMNFYDALQNQDLSETKLAFVRDMFIVFYENLSRDIDRVYSCKESWLLSLGFYTSFQLESMKSEREDKILLSGFEKIMSKRSVVVPGEVYDDLAGIYRLDKPYITDSDLVYLEKNLVSVIEYFTNYPAAEPLFNEIKDLEGVWQGILFNPDKEKYNIRLTVQQDLTASMDIDGVAYDVMISDIKVLNNYFTFMFKPFGTEKLYLKFNAKLCRDVFSGEITDVLGEKGYWVLAMTDKNHKLSEQKLDKMVSYINRIEKKLREAQKTAVPSIEKNEIPKVKPDTLLNEKQSRKDKVIPVKNDSSREPEEKQECKKTLKEKTKTHIEVIEEKKPEEITSGSKPSSLEKTMRPAKETISEDDYYAKDTGIIKKLKSFFGKLFSLIKF